MRSLEEHRKSTNESYSIFCELKKYFNFVEEFNLAQ